MLEIARYEVTKRLRGTAALVVGVAVFALVLVAFFPSLAGADVDIDAMLEAYPPAVREAFGIATLSTVEGFLAVEVYQFVWVLLLGLYFAYSAAGLIADDVERDRMDLTLSLPVSRSRVLVEKFLSLLVPILALNAVVGTVIYAAVLVIGESIDPLDLAMVHTLSIPYLLACGAVGLVLSVLVSRADVAKRIAIALVFVLFLVESVSASADGLEWIGSVSPTHYYDPTAVLVEGSYDLTGAAVLLVATVLLAFLARFMFSRADIGT
ncbi:ABC transporter permease subunit [Halalkalicoccus subterraneus]|uniref:ABC transporter permease subunit n=1 Tax=Halalkalicoccus subterraneus TaxID=2675002 RepID=UPI000EFA9EEF|nr:ABC transporter permease subunit [Halalkalicoccus subterraneus]